MTIFVDFANNKRRWSPSITYNIDKDDARTLTIDYTGELGTDTVSTATVTAKNIAAGTPAVSSNKVTIALSAGKECATASVDVKMTSTAGVIISRKIYFYVEDV